MHVGGGRRDFEADVSGGALALVEHVAQTDRPGAPDRAENGTATRGSPPESSVRRPVSGPPPQPSTTGIRRARWRRT